MHSMKKRPMGPSLSRHTSTSSELVLITWFSLSSWSCFSLLRYLTFVSVNVYVCVSFICSTGGMHFMYSDWCMFIFSCRQV